MHSVRSFMKRDTTHGRHTKPTCMPEKMGIFTKSDCVHIIRRSRNREPYTCCAGSISHEQHSASVGIGVVNVAFFDAHARNRCVLCLRIREVVVVVVAGVGVGIGIVFVVISSLFKRGGVG